MFSPTKARPAGARPRGRAAPALRAAALLLLTATLASGQEPAEQVRPLRTGGLGAETAALLLSGQEGGSIPLFAIALPGIPNPDATAPDARAPVEVFVEVPGAALLAGHEAESLRIELCLYALAGSRVVDSRLETVELDLARDRQRLLTGGIKSRSTLALPAGDYVVRVLVRNVQTGELGLRSFPVGVPAPGSEPLLQALLVPDPPRSWLRLARSAAPPAAGFWPAARPVLAPDGDAELQILVRGVEPDLARLRVGGAGDDSLEVPAAVTPAAGAAPNGVERWLVRARLPALAPGDYELSLRVADAGSSPTLPIVIRPQGAGTWVASGAAAPEVAAPPEPSLPTAGDRRGSRRETAALASRLAEEYRGALDRLAAADMLGAVAALSRLEAAAFEQEGGAAAVAAAEMETARALARAADGSLVPLFDLHYRAYRRYLEGQRFRLSSHARDLLLDLVDLHLSHRPDDTGPATDILVLMASQLQQSGLARFSSVVFRRALEVDPAHAGALLGLAAGLERSGEYREACDVLQQLLGARPEHREGRLRLAVNLARTGNRADGRRHLEALTGSGQRDWITAVAYQELARELIRRERLPEAEELLLAAGERLPGDDQLRLLLAAVRDARQVSGGGGGDGNLTVSSRPDRPSARHRYQEWPRFSPAADGESEERRRQDLAAALQGLRSAA